jgi:hypothetical protein
MSANQVQAEAGDPAKTISSHNSRQPKLEIQLNVQSPSNKLFERLNYAQQEQLHSDNPNAPLALEHS